MCDCANRTFFALRCYQSKLSPAIIKVFVHILKFSPAKKHKETFPLSYFSVTKSTKSQQREHSPLFANSLRVYEFVARSSAWRARATKDKAKVGGFTALRNLILPRVRIYHTKKPSRFVHALSHPHTNTGDAVARIFIFPYSSFKSFL